jgi:hypothetical protein
VGLHTNYKKRVGMIIKLRYNYITDEVIDTTTVDNVDLSNRIKSLIKKYNYDHSSDGDMLNFYIDSDRYDKFIPTIKLGLISYGGNRIQSEDILTSIRLHIRSETIRKILK